MNKEDLLLKEYMMLLQTQNGGRVTVDTRPALQAQLDKILSLGYVQLDTDQSLPENPYPQTTMTSSASGMVGRHGYDEAQRDMFNQNWKKVKE